MCIQYRPSQSVQAMRGDSRHIPLWIRCEAQYGVRARGSGCIDGYGARERYQLRLVVFDFPGADPALDSMGTR